MSNDIICLFQVLGYIQVTNTYFFFHKHEVPQGLRVTQIRLICDIHPQKKETYRVQPTVGGDKLIVYIPLSTPISNLKTFKLHWNSVVSNPGTKYLLVDVKNCYLANLVANCEQYKIGIRLIPQYIIDKYNLIDNKVNSLLYISVQKGIYGLFQVGIIAHMALKEYLRPFRYDPASITPGFRRHKKNLITFTLLVDEFVIRYHRIEYALHLINTLQENMK